MAAVYEPEEEVCVGCFRDARLVGESIVGVNKILGNSEVLVCGKGGTAITLSGSNPRRSRLR